MAAIIAIGSKNSSADIRPKTVISVKNVGEAVAKAQGAPLNEISPGGEANNFAAGRDNSSKPGQIRNFSLNTPAGKQAYYDYLIQQSPSDIYKIWPGAAIKNDPDEVAQIVAALGYSLRIHPDSQTYKKIGDDLLNRNNSIAIRLGSADILLFAGSGESIEQLIRFVKSTEAWTGGASIAPSSDIDVVAHAVRMIEGVVKANMDGGRNWPVSSLLLKAWNSVDDVATPKLIDVIANGIVYLGKPTDVDELLKSIGRLNAIGYKHESALRAIEAIHANESVDVMASALKYYQGDVAKSIVRGLISIGTADSILVVMQYVDSGVAGDTIWVNEIKKSLRERRSSPEVNKVLMSWQRS